MAKQADTENPEIASLRKALQLAHGEISKLKADHYHINKRLDKFMEAISRLDGRVDRTNRKVHKLENKGHAE